MQYDENNAIDYEDDEDDDDNITQWNIVENNDSINKNTLQTISMNTKAKKLSMKK